jgi:hypothetical protein
MKIIWKTKIYILDIYFIESKKFLFIQKIKFEGLKHWDQLCVNLGLFADGYSIDLSNNF